MPRICRSKSWKWMMTSTFFTYVNRPEFHRLKVPKSLGTSNLMTSCSLVPVISNEITDQKHKLTTCACCNPFSCILCSLFSCTGAFLLKRIWLSKKQCKYQQNCFHIEFEVIVNGYTPTQDFSMYGIQIPWILQAPSFSSPRTPKTLMY